MSQVCTVCRADQPEENYYVQKTRVFRTCKTCIGNAKRKEKKPHGFALLSPEDQAAIKLSLQDRHLKIIDIAEKYGLNYATFCYWIRMGRVLP